MHKQRETRESPRGMTLSGAEHVIDRINTRTRHADNAPEILHSMLHGLTWKGS